MIGPALPPEKEAATIDLGTGNACTPWTISDSLGPQDIARNKRLKSVAKSTPWLDDWEFEQVGRSLAEARHSVVTFATGSAGKKRQRLDDPSLQASVEEPLASLQEALDRMSVWKVRMDNRLPHAVESSYQLAQVHAHSLFISSPCGAGNGAIIKSSVEQLRLAYSSAILRAINGLADAMQQQRIAAQSVAASCAKLGIPSWVVDIRHEATHNQMPNLSVLRLAAATLMDFFHKEYWQPRSVATNISIATTITAATTTPAQTTQDPGESTVKEEQQQDVLVNNNGTGTNNGYEFPVSRSVTTDLLRDLLSYTMQQTKVMDDEMKSKAAPSSSSPADGTLKRKVSSGSTKKSSKKTLSSKQAFLVFDANQSGSGIEDNDSDDDDDDDDDEMYLDGFNAPFSKPTLGTSTNRFAALQETKTSNNKKKTKKQKTDKSSNGSSNNTKEKKKKKERSAHHHAKQFCKHGTHHLDRAYHIALLYLVWGGATSSAESGDIPASQQQQQQQSGALIPSDVVKFPETDEGIRNARQLFSILLVVLGKEWPGFLHTLMVHLIDHILAEERSLLSAAGATTTDATGDKEQSTAVQDDAHARRKLYFLESWVQYLVSRDFVAHFYADLKSTTRKKAAGVAAPWPFLEKMRYPLNGICDRLLLVSSSIDSDTEDKAKGAATTSRGLATYFMDVLGCHRIPYYGVRFHGEPEVLSDDNEEGPGVAIEAEQVALDTVMDDAGSLGQGQEEETKAADSDNKAGLSLHEMESLLLSGETTCEDSKDAGGCEPSSNEAGPSPVPIAAEPNEHENPTSNGESRQKPRKAWVRCTLWEPCAIGAVPGYPCSS